MGRKESNQTKKDKPVICVEIWEVILYRKTVDGLLNYYLHISLQVTIETVNPEPIPSETGESHSIDLHTQKSGKISWQ